MGAGALGPVFRAYDAERERLVAVKLFTLDLPPDRVHRLVGEFEQLIAADVTHPAIVRPVATGIRGVAAFLAQDYVTVESLDRAIREYGPAPAVDTLRVADHLASALDSASLAGIVHGALHPRDVLVSTDETRLTGIGVAQALERVGVAPPVRRPYTAPERVTGAPASRQADVFSLAAMIFELLTGRRVTQAGLPSREALDSVAGVVDVAILHDAFARALAEDATTRFSTASDFVETLKGAFPQSFVVSLELKDTQMSDLPFDVPEATDRADVELPAHRAIEPDLRLGGADEEPYRHVDVPPVAMEQLAAAEEPVRAAEPFTHEASRSAVWPLVLALAIGLALGYAGGFAVGSRERPIMQADAVPAAAAAGREFTETPVSGASSASSEPKPAPAPPSPTRATTPAAPVRENGADERGSILIRSTPAGASVTVDGRAAGLTPATVRELTRGAHRVRLTREGYAAEERRIVVNRSRPTQSLLVPLQRERAATASSLPIPATPSTIGRFIGELAVESRPTGAKVFLDGKLIGTTPLAVQSIGAGEHAVRLERDGYRHWTASVQVVANERNRVTASLER